MNSVAVTVVVDVPENNEVPDCRHKGVKEETEKDDNHKISFPSLEKKEILEV
jgi:hypothetical protein